MTRSLRRTLLVWLLIPILILFSMGTLFVYQRALSYSEEAYDRALVESTNDVEQLVRTTLKNSGSAASLRSMKELQDILLSDQFDSSFFSILDEQGRLISGDGKLRIPNLDANTFDRKGVLLFDTSIDTKPIRAVLRRIYVDVGLEHRVWRIMLGETINKRKNLAGKILTGVVLPQVVIILVACLLVLIGIKQGLEPLESLRVAIARRSRNDMRLLDVGAVPLEVKPLLEEINRLLDRLQAMLDAQKRFTADTAHRLRTPLAGLSAQIDFALVQNNPPQTKHALEQIKKVSANLNHAIGQLLSFARNDSSNLLTLNMKTLDLAQLAQQVTAEWINEAAQKGIDLGFEGDGFPCAVSGDATRIKELLDNFVDNALRYCPRGCLVTVRVTRDGTLSVEDNGPGVDIAERDQIFERFRRGGEAVMEGSGLGLAIVKEIAEMHGGAVTAEESKSGGGLFSVKFPVVTSVESGGGLPSLRSA